jgi:hypothetical protein
METKRGFGGGGGRGGYYYIKLGINWPKRSGVTRGTRAPQFRNSLL